MLAITGMEVLTFLGAAMAVALGLAGAIAVLFTHWRKDTTAIVREENQDLRDRLGTVEHSDEQCKRTLAKHEATIQVLSDMVTGASAVSELATIVSFNHLDTVKRLDGIDRRLARRRT